MVKYIIIEGVDKSGKTTLINDPKVQEALKQKGYKIMYLPHGWFRKIIKPLQKIIGFGNPIIKMLYAFYHRRLFDKIFDYRVHNQNVLTDRSIISTFVYQFPELFERKYKDLYEKMKETISTALKELDFDEVLIVYLYPINKLSDLEPIRKELHKRYMTLLKDLSTDGFKVITLRTRDRDKRVKALLDLL